MKVSINYNMYRSVASYNSRVRFLVFHYTAVDFKAFLSLLTDANAGAHYLVPDPTDPSYAEAGFKDLSVFNLVDEKERAWHAGAHFTCTA